MGAIKKFLKKSGATKWYSPLPLEARLYDATPKELSPSQKYVDPIISPERVEATPEELQDPIVMPTEDDANVRRSSLEAQRKAQQRKGRAYTKNPGGALGAKSILG